MKQKDDAPLPVRIPSRPTPAKGACVTSVTLHPIEPLYAVGLSSGEVCLYSTYFDVFTTWAGPPPSQAAKVLSLAALLGEDDQQKCDLGVNAILHCVFLRGRLNDLQRHVVGRCLPSETLTVASARHLLFVVTARNSLALLDVVSNQLLCRWGCPRSNQHSSATATPVHRSSPLHLQYIITQIATFGPLVYLTVAQRAVFEARRGATRGDSSDDHPCGWWPAEGIPENLNEPYVYVLHLGYTNPAAQPTPKRLGVNDGAYMIAIQSAQQRGNSAKKVVSLKQLASRRMSLVIRAHPYAPLLLVLLDHTEVQVFVLHGAEVTTSKAAQLLLIYRGTDKAPNPPLQQQPLVDVFFMPTTLSTSQSKKASAKRPVCYDIEVAVLTPCRVVILDVAPLHPSGTTDSFHHDVTETEAPRTVEERCVYSLSSSSSPRLYFTRLFAWARSPDTLLALLSSGTLLELSANDLLAASTAVLSVRGWAQLPPSTASSLPLSKLPNELPLWALGPPLTTSLQSCHAPLTEAGPLPQRVLLSKPMELPSHTAQPSFQVSLIADVETISSQCICLRLCLTPPSQSPQPSLSTNVVVGHLLCGTTSTALLQLTHGYYFIGSRRESAYAKYPFLIVGLAYVESSSLCDDGGLPSSLSIASPPSEQSTAAVEEEEEEEKKADPVRGGVQSRMQVALFCLPADATTYTALYRAGSAQVNEGKAAMTDKQPSAPLAQVQHLPAPYFPEEPIDRGEPPKQLLSYSFQLSNDGVVPCVWGLWGTTTGEISATPPQRQLTMQSFYVSADTQQLKLHPPELVQITHPPLAAPSHVWALSTVLSSSHTRAPPLQEKLLETDEAVVARLFLYYADKMALVLATVELRGDDDGAAFAATGIDVDYNFFSHHLRDRGRVSNGSTGTDQRRPRLCLVPHAVAELTAWKASSSDSSSSVQISAVLCPGNEDAVLQVAIVSTCFGVATVAFPLPGQRESRQTPATLTSARVMMCRNWGELLHDKTTTLLHDGDGTASLPNIPVSFLQWVNRTPLQSEAVEDAPPVLLLQRGAHLLLLHPSGPAVHLCPSLPNCTPLCICGDSPAPSTEGDNVAPEAPTPNAEVRLQLGYYAGSLTRESVLRHYRLLQLLRLHSNSYISPRYSIVTTKAKQLRAFFKKLQSSTAACNRVKQAKYRQDALEAVYASRVPQRPSATTNCLPGPSPSFAKIGGVVEKNLTAPLGTAELSLDALVILEGINSLIASPDVVSPTLRSGFQRFAETLDTAEAAILQGRITRCPSAYEWAAVAAMAEVPLCGVTRLLSDMLHFVNKESDAQRGAAAEKGQNTPSAASQLWWWLMMQSCTIVSCVNAAEREDVVHFVEAMTPPSWTRLHPRSDGAVAAAELVPPFTAASWLLFGRPECIPTSDLQQLLDASGGLFSVVAVVLRAMGETSGQAKTAADAQEASSAMLTKLFSSVRVSSSNWVLAVQYLNVVSHLQRLADVGVEGAKQCVELVNADITTAAEAVREVVSLSLEVLRGGEGSIVEIPAATRTKMAAAIAACNDHQQGKSTAPQYSKRSAALLDTSFSTVAAAFHEYTSSGVFCPTCTAPKSGMQQSLYAAQWCDVYDTLAYPACFFFGAATEARPSDDDLQNLPYPVMVAERAKVMKPSGDKSVVVATDAPQQLSSVQNVIITHEPTTGITAAVLPAIELVPSSTDRGAIAV